MIAPHAASTPFLAPPHDVLRANQLLEAGLWLHLGGQRQEARSLFLRAQEMDPSNRRAREWVVKSEEARPHMTVVDPLFAPLPAEEGRTQLEVSVVLLDEAELAASSAMATDSSDSSEMLVLMDDAEAFPSGTRDALRGVATLLVGVEELLALGDATSALELLSKAEQVAPEDARVVAARARCASAQQAALETRLGSLKQVPMLKLRMAELMKLSLDARMGFLLSRIDGRLSYEALFTVSGMSRLDTLRVLARLLDQDIITLR